MNTITNANTNTNVKEKEKEKEKEKTILIVSGGGIKGLAGLGAISYLIDNKIISFPKIFAGSSVGAIICFLINIGYHPKDIYDILEQIDFTKLIKYVEPEDLLVEPCFGLSTPEPILQSIYSFMKKKNIKKNITFKELFEQTNSKLIITGTCINNVELVYFSYDTYPNMPILKALRISISIPFIFRPYMFEGKLWVDGSCMNNFPIELFDPDDLDKVIGVYLDDKYDGLDEIEEIQDYFHRIFKCVFRGLNYNKILKYKKYLIDIITTNVKKSESVNGSTGTNWDLSIDDKKILFDTGYFYAREYVESNKNFK